MAYEIPGFSFSHPADEALAQFRFVKITTTGVAYADNGEYGIAVVQNTPAIGEAATLVTSGIVMVEAGTGGLTAGDNVAADTDGVGITAATADLILGVALSDAAVGEYASVLLNSGPAASA